MNFQDYERNFENVIDNVCSDDPSLDHYYDEFASPQSTTTTSSSPASASPSTSSKNYNSNNSKSNKSNKSNKAISKRNDKRKNTTTPASKSGWLGRQIAAAYDEHASIIKSLRRELEESKTREQALIQEFSIKFEELQIQLQTDTLSHNHTNSHNHKKKRLQQMAMKQVQQLKDGSSTSASASASASLPFDEEDMPMDEKADINRMERTVRTMELIEQKQILEEFKKQSDQMIQDMRIKSETQVKAITKALKDKVQEIDLLKRESNFIVKERNYYKHQISSISPPPLSSSSSSPMGVTSSPLSPSHSDHADVDTSDESIPIHSFMLQNHMTPSPNGNNNTNANDSIHIDVNIDLTKPIPLTPVNISSITPIDRMRRANSVGKIRGTTRPVSESPLSNSERRKSYANSSGSGSNSGSGSGSGSDKRKKSHRNGTGNGNGNSNGGKVINFENSVIAIDGSAYEHEHEKGNGNRSMNNHEKEITNMDMNETEGNIIMMTPMSNSNSNSNSPNSMNNTSTSSSLQQLPTPRQLLEPSGEHQHLNSFTFSSLQRLTRAIELTIQNKNGNNNHDDDNNTSMDSNQTLFHELNNEEAHIVQKVHEIYKTKQQQEKKTISNLTTKLHKSEQKNQINTKHSSQMKKEIKEKDTHIKYLENQLNSAHASIRNTADLEGVLNMVANDRKATDLEESTLKLRMNEVEMERNELLKERDDTCEETMRSISAIQRVMADVTVTKDKVIDELNMKVNELEDQNKLWRRKIMGDRNSNNNNPMPDDESNGKYVIIEEIELTKMRNDAKRSEELEKELMKVKTLLKNTKSANTKVTEEKTTLQNNIDTLLKEKNELEARLKDIGDAQNIELHAAKEKHLFDEAEHGKTVGVLLAGKDELVSSKEELEKVIEDMTKEIETHKGEMSNVEEVLKAAKGAHEREQKLEDELSDLRDLLNGTVKNKTILRSTLQSKEEQLIVTNKQFQKKINDLQSKVISMKEEKLELKTNLRKAEESSKRSARVLSVLQETGEMEDAAPQIVLDIKEHLREQYNLANHLRQTCVERNHHDVDQLSDGINTTLCLLEAAIFGNAMLSPKSVSDIAHWNEPSTLSMMDAQKKMIKTELEEEMNSERDQEIVVLHSELNHVKTKNEEYANMLSKKDQEMNVLRASLKDLSVGYISGDESDIEDDMVSNEILPLHAGLNNSGKMEEILKAKEKAETEAKENAERLANAKMIISSLEQSNKSMTEDLKSRLHDSNSAIVSLLDQSGKQEKESADLRSKLSQLKSEKSAVEDQLISMKIQTFQAESSTEKSSTNLSQVGILSNEKEAGSCEDLNSKKNDSTKKSSHEGEDCGSSKLESISDDSKILTNKS